MKKKSKPTVKKFAQCFALSEYLSDIPSQSFDQIIDNIRNHDDVDITVAERYENESSEDLADMICDKASDLELAFMRVHDGEFIVGKEN